MKLIELFSADVVNLNLTSESKDDTIDQLVSLLQLDEKSEGVLHKTLKRRENLGSTGIGRGIAIPHCRSLVVSRLRLAFGRRPGDDSPLPLPRGESSPPRLRKKAGRRFPTAAPSW